MRILMVFGTRPEAIKMAPLARALMENTAFELTLCVTAQHREMLDQVLRIFDLHPDIDLDIMRPGQGLFEVTTSILSSMKSVLSANKPELVLVHGDTTTAFAATLAAFYMQIPTGHVEAGLRTYDLAAPFPEELNRQLISRMAAWHFAPTEKNRETLIEEGVKPDQILVTGNTVVDALLWMRERLLQDERIHENVEREIKNAGWAGRSSRPYILITGHRRENFGRGFIQICTAIRKLAMKYGEMDFVYPVHLNPQVQKPVREYLSGLSNVFCIHPLSYGAFVYMMMGAHLILTDSGGIQEEAPSLGKPTLVMRNTTERSEAVEAGTVLLAGTDTNEIFNAVDRLLSKPACYQQMVGRINPYGDGKASSRIVHFLQEKVSNP